MAATATEVSTIGLMKLVAVVLLDLGDVPQTFTCD
jgi:hypothetical protein